MFSYQFWLLLFLITIPVFLFFIRNNRQYSFNKYIIVAVSIIMILLLMYRSEGVGVDTVNYYQSFVYSTYLITDSYEYSWGVICYFVQFFLHGDIHVVLLIYAAFTILPISYVVLKESRYPYMSLLLYVILFYVISFNIMRHMAAASMCLLFTYFFVKKQWIKAAISLVVAIALHNSALAFCAIVIITSLYSNKKIKNSTAIRMLFLCLFVGYFLFDLLSYLIGLSPMEKYRSYQDYALSRNVNINNIFIMNVANTIWGSLILSRRNKSTNNDWYFRLYLISLYLENIVAYQIGLNRIIYFCSINSIIFIPNLVLNMPRQKGVMEVKYNLRIISIYIVYLLAWFYFNLSRNNGGLF